MKRIMLGLFLLLGGTLNAQYELSVHAGAGAGYISNSATVNMNHLYYGSPLRSYPRMSFEGGFTQFYHFDKLSLSMGTNYTQINAFQKEDTYGGGNSTSGNAHIFVEKERKIGYLSIPLMLHKRYKILSFGGGLQPQFVIHIKEEKRLWTGEYFGVPPHVETEKADRTINTFDLGLIGQLNVKATDRLSANFKVYWGLTNMNNFGEKGAYYEHYGYEYPVVDRKLKSRHFIVSLQYKIVKN